MDVNDDVNDPNSKIENFRDKCNLFDIMQSTNSIYNSINTHIRGSKRIDTIMVSHHLQQYIKTTQILDFGEILNSDHHVIICDIDLNPSYNLLHKTVHHL